MTPTQRFLSAVLSKERAEEMRQESQQWVIRCCTCGHTKNLWEAGGIRWKKRSTGSVSYTLIHCPHCGGLKRGKLEHFPAEERTAGNGNGSGNGSPGKPSGSRAASPGASQD